VLCERVLDHATLAVSLQRAHLSPFSCRPPVYRPTTIDANSPVTPLQRILSSSISPLGDGMGQADPSVRWSHCPSDLLVEILGGFLEFDAQLALLMSQVCVDWRHGILNDRYLLENLNYKMVRRVSTASGDVDDEADDPKEPFPAVFSKSLMHGNATAHVARAKFYSHQGDNALALASWKTAAKRNHPLALFKWGMHLYESFDPEDAYLYLKRACKHLMVGSDEDLFTMTNEERQELLRSASLILGIIICDNDLEFESVGFDKDYSGAIAWLKVARDRGCSDAANIMNSLFRNGNY